jgi:hypothetical protein
VLRTLVPPVRFGTAGSPIEAGIRMIAARIQSLLGGFPACVQALVDPLAASVQSGIGDVAPVTRQRGHGQGNECKGGNLCQLGFHSTLPSAMLMLLARSTPLHSIG